jgi:hypothetical protein
MEPEAFADEGGVRKAWRARANVDDDLAALLTDCIAVDDERRPRDGAALRARLDGEPARRVAPASPAPSRSGTNVAVGAAAVVTIVVGAVLALFLSPSDASKGPTHVTAAPPAMPEAPTPPPPPPTKATPSERLGVPGLFEAVDCLSRAERALTSENRYRSWRKGDAAPTCKESYISYGLYTLYDDAPGGCASAAQAATTSDALKAAAQELSEALVPLTATAKEADSYYESEDYRDDGCVKAKALHERLLPEFARVRAAFERVEQARDALAKSPPPSDPQLARYRRALDAAFALEDRTLAPADRRAAVDAYERALADTPKPLSESGTSIESLRKWARGTGREGLPSVIAPTASAIESALRWD